MTVIPVTWLFQIKRFLSGLICKYKARLCERGDLQQDNTEPYLDSLYAPVVTWAIVRLLLILSLILGLATLQIDYTLAFFQALIDTTVYIQLPRGWSRLNYMGLPIPFKENCILKLNRSLYGLKQSPKNFFLHLKRYP